ncbi:caspase, EACC1-associated type [Dactylosporangium matsuzakiense]|uniref:Peptidase C14 caspase domain-containing protein n=1 Tax=Dactylosporangium matsuzakiense TaxID=53360 RepID=A0A9W6NIY2_9ACTN|nr:caspase family protein [Dactylosporangium matsuzakiense]UWZ47100.1 caspase family protein [Dactylosporangium matsuzakiense]GLK98465.1 hypothetical protein GCM10017581_002060 [Dactylosporangium matsuzakiense]
MTVPSERSGGRFALVVATGQYQDAAFSTLHAPGQDARDMIEVLGDPEVGQFDVDAAIDLPDHQIRRRIGEFLDGRHPDDLILLYFSCHGALDTRGRLHLIGTDTSRRLLPTTALSSPLLLDVLDSCRARSQIVILDCCFSGSFANKGGPLEQLVQDQLTKGARKQRGRVVLTACRDGELSFEGTAPPDTPIRSVFTAALVEGLRTGEADRTGEGFISVIEAFNYAVAAMDKAGSDQSPQHSIFGGEGEIVLARNPRALPVQPAPLPAALRANLESPYPPVRHAAIEVLTDLLRSPNPAVALAARQELQLIASRDVPLVAEAALRALHGPGPIPGQRTAPTPGDGVSPAVTAVAPAAQPATPDKPVVTLAPTAIPTTTVRVLKTRKPVEAIAFSSLGDVLASGGADDLVRLWNPHDGRLINTLAGHSSWVRAVAFSPGGDILASGGGDGTVRLWNAADGTPLMDPLSDHLFPVTSVAFSPDGRQLASGSEDGTVCLWAVPTGEQLDPPGNEGAHVRSLVFSPDGRMLAVAREDDTIEIHLAETGEIARLPGHTQIVTSMAIAPDNSVLAAGSLDQAIRLWDLGDLRDPHQADRPITKQQRWPASLAFSADGRLLAAADDRRVRLWDWRRRREVCNPLEGHTRAVKSVAFSLTGELLATAGDDGTIRLWQAPDA